MKLEPIIIKKDTTINQLLSFFMGKNTQKRQEFIVDNLRIEKDLVEEVTK